MAKLIFSKLAKIGYINIKKTYPTAISECLKLLRDLERVGSGLGKKLENKNGMDLSSCYKLYFYNAMFRIVYRPTQDGKMEIIDIIAIGKRNNFDVYRDVYTWLMNENKKQ